MGRFAHHYTMLYQSEGRRCLGITAVARFSTCSHLGTQRFRFSSLCCHAGYGGTCVRRYRSHRYLCPSFPKSFLLRVRLLHYSTGTAIRNRCITPTAALTAAKWYAYVAYARNRHAGQTNTPQISICLRFEILPLWVEATAQ